MAAPSPYREQKTAGKGNRGCIGEIVANINDPLIDITKEVSFRAEKTF